MPPFDTNSLASLVTNAYRPIRNNKLKFILYALLALIGALLLSVTFGQHYDSSSQKLRGAPKQRRDASQVTGSGGGDDETSTIKDPYANRPRIRTRNGHLVIEASRDKNIDFKTSGSRGTVTINGHKLDQLLNVTKALEKSEQFITTNGRGGGASGSGFSLFNGNQKAAGGNQYELLLRNLFGSGERVALLERSVTDLKAKFGDLDSRLVSIGKKIAKRMNLLAAIGKQQETMLAKLKRNDCFHPETGQPVCKNGATCVDGYDDFKCLCTSQFEGSTCSQDVDECEKFRGTELGCQNGATCINLPGGYRCECQAQYHGVHCTELYDDCTMSSQRSLCANGKCVNLARSAPNQPKYECICDQGWTTDGQNPACIMDINECLAGQTAPSSSLPLVAGNATAPLFGTMSARPNSLLAAYPCSQNPYVECTNLPGSFQCGPCPAGYTGNGRLCVDLDECLINNGGCSIQPLVECINTQGYRRCGSCPAGYTGDGVTCSRISACQSQPNGGCHPMARCIELTGVSLASRLCVCQYPYSGDGTSGPDGCKPLPTSRGPTAGAGASTSNTTYTDQSKLAKQDDCNPSPCYNGATCRRTESSFECICPIGWMGPTCWESAPVCGGSYFVSQGGIFFTLSGSSTSELLLKSESPEVATDPEAPGDRVSMPPVVVTADKNGKTGASGGGAAARQGERHYKCKWSITVAPNMSIRLDLSGFMNKLNPSQKILMFLTNGTNTVHRHHQKLPPTCKEYLDVWDRLDLGSVQLDQSERRLLARFCSDQSVLAPPDQSLIPTKTVSILTESHGAQLDYTFMATRSAFGDPNLSFQVNWQAIDPPCGGEIYLSATNPSGSITSPKFPEFYEPGTECRYLLRATSGKRLRIQFGELSLLTGGFGGSGNSDEWCADSLTVLDGAIGIDRPLLLRHCANNATLASPRFPSSPLVSSSSVVEIILASNFNSTTPLLRPKQRKGFLLTYSEEPVAPGCGGTYTHRSGTIRSGDYEPAQNVNLEDDAYFGQQLAAYMAERMAARDGSDLEAQQYVKRLMNDMWHSMVKMASYRLPGRYSWWYKSRCEYVIKPNDMARNHKVSIDWLELPREPDAVIDIGGGVGGEMHNSRLSRRWICSRSRLTIYDGDPLDGSNRTEIISFCSGDKYNSSLPMFAPIVSTGRLLYLVYETTIVEDHSNGGGSGGSGSGSTRDTHSPVPVTNQANGFKLHYSTVCSAVYSHLADRIRVEISPEVPECVYHIALPPHNTISLVVEPQMSESITNLANGACAAQAIFLDGALQQGAKSTLMGMERELRSYNLGSDGQLNNGGDSNRIPVEDSNFTTAARGDGDGDGGQRFTKPAGDSIGSKSKDSYWQYSSSQVHDIKEFEVCKLPELKFDSIWNHLSILFRLNPRVSSSSSPSSSWSVLPPTPAEPTISEPIQLTVRYRSEPSCGGILSDQTGGKIRLDSMISLPLSAQNQTAPIPNSRPQGSPPSMSTNFNKSPGANKLTERPCAWVFRASTNQVVQFEFEVPVAEIKRRFNDWLSWSYSSFGSKSSKLSGGGGGPEFNCSQVFQEMIEIYEPSINRTRQLCPIDLMGITGGFSTLNSTNTWITSSSIALMRLRNTTELATPINSTHWPGLRPLGGDQPIRVAYQFKAAKGRKCGGRLLHASGVITSPRYPLYYPPMANCVWVIQAPNAHQQIRLNVTSFNLEGSPNCLFDFLELRNGPSEESPLIGRFCDHDLQSKVLISHSNQMWLRFKSDGHLSRPGFEIRYDGAQTGCGGRLTTASGQIDSPNYPYPFAHSADCEWTIELSQSNKIELTINDLDLSSSDNQQAVASAGCSSQQQQSPPTSATGTGESNYLAIYESSGASDQAMEPLVKVCHKSQLESMNKTVLISASNKLFIVFKSRALDQSRGFRLTYRTLCSSIELIGFRGVIESPGYPANYPARIFCNWTIRAPLGSNLTLALTELDMEDGTGGIGGDSGNATSSTSSLDSAAAAAPIVDYSTRTIKRAGWPCPVDALVVWAVYSKYSPSSKQQSLTNANSTAKTIMTGNSKPLSINVTSLPPPKGEPNSRMVQYYCGQLTKLSDKDRYLELDTNVAYLSFESDRSVEGRGFRLEWRSEGCGNSQVSDSVEPIVYRESDIAPGRPTECLWSFQLAKAAGTIEFLVSSDMRSALAAAGQMTSRDPCDGGALTIFDGLTDRAPILHRNCDAQLQRVSIATSGGQALVRFYTDGNNTNGRNFVLTGQLVHRDDCLSSEVDILTPFNQRSGFKQSPQYPDLYDGIQYHCFGSFGTNKGRMRFTIEELDIPVDVEQTNGQQQQQQPAGDRGLLSQEQCRKSGNYLRIRGLMQSEFEEFLCGRMDKGGNSGDLARSTIVTEQEASLVEFRTSKSVSRGRWRFSYDRLCGSFVPIYFARDFSTPNYPERPKWPSRVEWDTKQQLYQQQHEDRACIWRVSTSFRQPGTPGAMADKNKLHFGLINFVESPNPNDCLRVYEGVELSLRTSYFNLTDLDRRLAPKLKICKQSDLTHRALFYVSLGAELIILVTGNAVAKFRAKPFEDFCGAELQLDQGEFASLGYPEPYGPNLDCSYLIMGSPGSRVELKFIDFDLPEGDSLAPPGVVVDPSNSTTRCDNVDYVEIRQMSAKKLIEQRLKLPGSEYFADLPDETSNQDSQANQNGQLSPSPPSSSNATSSLSPMDRLSYLSKLYNLFNDPRHHSSPSINLFQTGVSLSDFHENSNLVGRFCGNKAPQLSGLNMRGQILVRLRSHGPPEVAAAASGRPKRRAPKGFLAEYKLAYGGLFKLIDKSSMEGGVIGSPRYPGKTFVQGTITWKFETKLDYILQFELVSLELGSVHQPCQDALSIYDGLDTTTVPRLSRMCGRLFFKSNFMGSSGSSNTRQWMKLIQGPNGGYQQLSNFTAIYRAHEPEVKSNLIRVVRSSFNVATVVYENRNAGEASFLLRYRATKFVAKNSGGDDLPDILEQPLDGLESDKGDRNVSKSCSNSYLLSLNQQNSSQILLTSPNWPKLPPTNGIECHWLVYTHENTIIKLTFDATSSQMATSGDSEADNVDEGAHERPDYCLDPRRTGGERRPFVIVHDGASRLSPTIGRYCLPASPITVKSSGRHMLVRYVNPTLSERGTRIKSNSKFTLFKALASVSECGGQYHITTSALISNKAQWDFKRRGGGGRKREYANNLQCRYHLFAGSLDEVLMINEPLSKFDLAKEPTNANCTVGDYLEIRDLPIQSDLMDYSRASQGGRLLGRFCAGHPLQDLESPGSAISLDFRTDSENVATGWSLFVTSSMPHINCPKGYMRLQMDDLYGRITSPNWPHGFTGKRQCRYLLVAPTNQSIQVNFVRLRRPHGDGGVEPGDDRCTDSFNYLADNEAWAMRYRSEPLTEILSPLSGARLGELVRTMPCNSSASPSASSDRLDELLSSSSSSSTSGSAQDGKSDSNQSFKKITGEEYYKLLELPQSSFSIGPTRSHVLMLNYETRNLLPNEGFVAVIRLAPMTPDYGCGLSELSFRQLGGPTNQSNPEPPRSGNENLFQSGSFGLETKLEDDYIQCEWSLRSSFTDEFAGIGFESTGRFYSESYSQKLTTSSELGTFFTPFIVFETLEIPPQTVGQSLIDQDWNGNSPAAAAGKQNAICGLNRMILTDNYNIDSTIACGNLTNSVKWLRLAPYMSTIHLRTKNLRLSSLGPAMGAQSPTQKGVTSPEVFYRGVKGRLYAKGCVQEERLVGESIRFRSHHGFPNSSYQPGVCQWQVVLSGGDYHLWFDSVKFRLPNTKSPTQDNNTNCDLIQDDLDYLEIRASSGGDAPLISRICAYNQMEYTQKRPLQLSMRNELKLVFVAGIDRLMSGLETFNVNGDDKQLQTNFGFNLELVRVRNISDFCRRDSRGLGIYWFIGNKKNNHYAWSPSMASFLYPNNTHCEIPMALDEGQRFNFTFRGMFDFESSPDCKSDYIQIDDIFDQPPVSGSKVNEEAAAVGTKQKKAPQPVVPKGANNQANKTQVQSSTKGSVSRIGRWCGRVRPPGYFVSKSERVRITFHSNDRVEGKGFQLEYSIIPSTGNSTKTGNGRQLFSKPNQDLYDY